MSQVVPKQQRGEQRCGRHLLRLDRGVRVRHKRVLAGQGALERQEPARACSTVRGAETRWFHTVLSTQGGQVQAVLSTGGRQRSAAGPHARGVGLLLEVEAVGHLPVGGRGLRANENPYQHTWQSSAGDLAGATALGALSLHSPTRLPFRPSCLLSVSNGTQFRHCHWLNA